MSTQLYNVLPVVGGLAGYLTDDPRKKSIYSSAGTLAGGLLSDILSDRKLGTSGVLSPAFLGNVFSTLGSTLYKDKPQVGAALGRLGGAALSSFLQDRNVLDDITNPAFLQNIGGTLGTLGGRTGGILGLLAGNVVGNVAKGGDVVSNLLSTPNLAGLGTGLLSFLLPKNLDPAAKTTLSLGTSMLASALTGSMPTIGTAVSSLSSTLGSALSPALASIPVALPLYFLSTAFNIWQDRKYQKKQRKQEKRLAAEIAKAKQQMHPQFSAVYEALKPIGEMRMKIVDALYDKFYGLIPKESIMQKYGIVNDSGLTKDEQRILLGWNPEMNYYTFKDLDQPVSNWTRGADILMDQFLAESWGKPKLDWSKLEPWLNATTAYMLRLIPEAEYKSKYESLLPIPKSYYEGLLNQDEQYAYRKAQEEFARTIGAA